MMKPIVAITAGDPAGIGPEICLKALRDPRMYEECRPLVAGDARSLAGIAASMGLPPVRRIEHPSGGRYEVGEVDVIDISEVDITGVRTGAIQPAAGLAALSWIREATRMALAREVDGVCTAPISKEAIVKAGVRGFLGHTEYLGEMCGVPDPLTMFVVGNLRILFLTRHVSLAEAVASVKAGPIEQFVEDAEPALRAIGVENPRLAIAGLNPHSGEGGLFGVEELTEIAPAVLRLREKGFSVAGPVPADSVFYQARNGRYDAVVSLYHDQGHIAAKTLDFERTVSVTLGLPFIRTSVDHGTAFDIAGKGVASDVSMKEAIAVAAGLARKVRERH